MSDAPIEAEYTDLTKAIRTPPLWVIRDVLPEGLTIIWGPPKEGKSTLALALALSVADIQRPCLAIPRSLRQVESDGVVLIHSFEGDAGELLDVAVGGMEHMPPEDMVYVKNNPLEWALDKPEGMTRLMARLNETNPRLLLLDPFRNAHRADENDAGAMNQILMPLRNWAKQTHSAVVLIHHSKKPGPEGRKALTDDDMRGSTAIFGAVDGLISVSSTGDKTHLRARYRRGAAWEKTIRLGVYGQDAEEMLVPQDHTVMKAMRAGGASIEALASTTRITELQVRDSLRRLVEHEMLAWRDNKWHLIQTVE